MTLWDFDSAVRFDHLKAMGGAEVRQSLEPRMWTASRLPNEKHKRLDRSHMGDMPMNEGEGRLSAQSPSRSSWVPVWGG